MKHAMMQAKPVNSRYVALRQLMHHMVKHTTSTAKYCSKPAECMLCRWGMSPLSVPLKMHLLEAGTRAEVAHLQVTPHTDCLARLCFALFANTAVDHTGHVMIIRHNVYLTQETAPIVLLHAFFRGSFASVPSSTFCAMPTAMACNDLRI